MDRRLLIGASVAAFAAAFAAGAGANAMWPRHEKQPPSRRETQFDNDEVSAWKSIIMPNQPLKLHRHDHARALIPLTDGRLEVVDKSGKLLDTYNLTRGVAIWLKKDPPGQQHADVNATGKPIEVVIVQLKNDTQVPQQ